MHPIWRLGERREVRWRRRLRWRRRALQVRPLPQLPLGAQPLAPSQRGSGSLGMRQAPFQQPSRVMHACVSVRGCVQIYARAPWLLAPHRIATAAAAGAAARLYSTRSTHATMGGCWPVSLAQLARAPFRVGRAARARARASPHNGDARVGGPLLVFGAAAPTSATAPP